MKVKGSIALGASAQEEKEKASSCRLYISLALIYFLNPMLSTIVFYLFQDFNDYDCKLR